MDCAFEIACATPRTMLPTRRMTWIAASEKTHAIAASGLRLICLFLVLLAVPAQAALLAPGDYTRTLMMGEQRRTAAQPPGNQATFLAFSKASSMVPTM